MCFAFTFLVVDVDGHCEVHEVHLAFKNLIIESMAQYLELKRTWLTYLIVFSVKFLQKFEYYFLFRE